MSRFKKACVLILLALFVPLTLDAARAPDWKHEDIWLKNEQGQRITPTRNSTDPYSPRKTCGTCHGYMTITSGTHFQQGFDEMKDGYDPKRPWVLSPGNFGKGGAPGTFTETGRREEKRQRPRHGPLHLRLDRRRRQDRQQGPGHRHGARLDPPGRRARWSSAGKPTAGATSRKTSPRASR